MPTEKRVLVACGTAIATATVVAEKVKEIAKEAKYHRHGPLQTHLSALSFTFSATTTIFALFLFVYMLGQWQLHRIERRTAQLVLEMSQEWLAKKPNITATGLYKRIYPRWSQSVQNWGVFIPHRLELWPVPVRPETVQSKISFSPQWIASLLAKHGIQLKAPGDEIQDEQ